MQRLLEADPNNLPDDRMSCQQTDPLIQDEAETRNAALLTDAGRFIRNDDERGLLSYLRRSWSVGELSALLHGDDSVLSWVAAYCLGLIGGPVAVVPLARALHHDDPAVVSAAEDALWRAWFDDAGVGVRRRLQRAADHLDGGRYGSAIAVLDDTIKRHPSFAESYHQRAIVRYLLDDHFGAIADCKRTLTLNRCHFGAFASMGHAHAHLGQYSEAFNCYRAALNIHPRLEGVRQSMRRIQLLERRRNPVA